MFNIANNHRIPLVKTAFYFSLYTRKMAAILPLLLSILRQRMFIASGVYTLLIVRPTLCSTYA
ncbi:hypothetical protein S616_21480 [Salmonella enterica subsp. enterica]|nr:hypothetical protein [Salmonella enterica subsp. houtenae serovar 44:z4,z23:-]EBX5570151.1 hypothetical protein [Salmonella enterica subsp. enterica serovar Kuessel]EBZ2911726.1 hypothetical protein [Salmonella enterica subsp. enterica serovar Mesbit]ECA1327999.1 hypothetical protein [Salmonella enterica subsp. enterica serovar Leatherhead]ECB3865733.1 hypothetical protein [Salmonella enterica subsp. enterica serovar Oranienburg]ECH8836746.1 hypothetical protein [Salmonella enterica subsp. 